VITRSAALVLVQRDQHRYAAALRVGRTDSVARRLRRDHHHVEVLARHDLAVVDVEAMGEGERCALLDVRLDLGGIGRGNMLIWHQHHHEVGALHGSPDLLGLEAGLLHLVPRGSAFADTDHDLHAGVVEVLRMRMALRAVTDDGDLLAFDQLEVAILVVENLHVEVPSLRERWWLLWWCSCLQHTFAARDA
jgi:hypothetical protein